MHSSLLRRGGSGTPDGLSLEDKDALEFRQGLLATSYSEGRDVVIEWRFANGNYAQMPQLVTELIQSKPELIVVEITAAAQAVKRATSTIPMVMVVVADPVGSRLVPSLAHSQSVLLIGATATFQIIREPSRRDRP